MNLFTEQTKQANLEISETERVRAIQGVYEFRSPYHKSKKMLPFVICGLSYSKDEFNVSCQTVSYRGWERKEESGNWSLESLESKIESGFLILKTN